MKAVCPTDPSHNRFTTTAHVMEEWEVDEEGDWVRTISTLQVTHGPDVDNVWTCVSCGAEADVSDE